MRLVGTILPGWLADAIERELRLEPMTRAADDRAGHRGRPRAGRRRRPVERIAAGLTNTNYRVEVDGTPFFVRIPGEATDLLAVDRNELHNTRAAAEAGVGRAWSTLPRNGTCSSSSCSLRRRFHEALAKAGCAGGIAASLRTLHAGPRFQRDFNMSRLSERYLALVDERDIAIPAGYRAPWPLPRIKRHWSRSLRHRPVPQ